MRILVDYRPALRARTGVGEYIHHLIRAYVEGSPDDDVTAFTSSWKDRPAPGLQAELGARIVDRHVPGKLLNLLWHRAGWPPVERLAGPVDVVHAAHPLLIPARHAAQVITVHDLFFLTNPERTAAEIKRDYATLAPSHARRAHAVVTSTEYGKRIVMQRLAVSAERVYVCRPGAPSWRELGRTVHLPDTGYVLFLGTLEPRKNIGALLDAWELLHARAPQATLVLAGGTTPEAEPWLRRLTDAALGGTVSHLGYVDANDRERLFAGARALVLPSLDEGFGLTALEAMSAGVPVVASDRGSLPEVVGDAAPLVDPTDPRRIADALERVLSDRTWAAGRAEAGLERAKSFTWAGAAATLRQAYREASARRQAEQGARAHRH